MKSVLFRLKINAPKGATYYIDYGDGTEKVTKTGSGRNEIIDYHFADMEKVKEHGVKVWGANFTEFMVISNQKVTEISLTDCTVLINFSCATSLLIEMYKAKESNLQCQSNRKTIHTR